MNNLYEKYAGLERKITQMTSKTWDTKRELNQIDQNIRASFNSKPVRAKHERLTTLSQDASKNLKEQQKKQVSPQQLFQ